MIAGPDTPEGEKLDIMVTLIEAYEASKIQRTVKAENQGLYEYA